MAVAEELARILFEDASDAVFLLDAGSRRVVDANGAAARMCGRARASLVGATLEQVLPKSPESNSDALPTPAGGSLSTRVFPCGDRIVVIVHGTAARDEAAARYRRLFENTLAGVFRCTGGGRLLECNDAFARIFGYPNAESMRDVDLSTLHIVSDSFDTKFAELIQSGKIVGRESRMRRVDGSEVWVLENSYVVDALGDQHVEGTVVDITQKKRAESDFAKQHALMRAVFESTPDMLFFKGRDGCYRGCNQAFERYFGVQESEVIGKRIRDVFPEIQAELEKEDQFVYETRMPSRAERWFGTGGNRRLIESVLTPLIDEDGNVLGLLGVGRDITDRRKSEEQLRQSSKMEAIGQLAGGVAHDFNNLLTIILGSLQLAASSIPEGHEARDSLADVEAAARRAAELTGQLLGFARRAPMSMVPTDLNRCVQTTVAILRRALDPRIVVVASPSRGAWLVDAAAPQIEQVLMNVLLNARDAMPGGGTINVSIQNVEVSEARARDVLDARPGDHVRISVEDTGVGIDEESISRIFEPFFTTKPTGQGTGLGLAMAYGIVRQHKGWIECQSTRGKGARFDIYLPRSASQPERKAKPAISMGQGSETILLVDDEPMIRNLGKLTLERCGYKVLLASDGHEAVKVFEERHVDIAVVVLDLTMPLMTGQEVLREIRKIDPSVRVLFASGYSADSFGGNDMSGIMGFLQKPYRPDELAAAVRAAVDKT